MTALRSLALALMTLWLAGCAGLGVSGRDDGEHWALTGKLGLRQADQAESLLLAWSQCGERYQLTFSAPLGQPLARVEGDDQGALFWLDRTPEYTRHPQQWLDQRLGWPLPLQPLRHWVRGQPAPELPAAVERDDQGRLQRLQQAGWQVDYLDHFQEGELSLPRRLRVQRDDRTATLIIRRWQLGPEVTTCPPP